MSGLYNVVFGYNRATMLLAPMLTDDDPREFFPRFRDCYTEDGDIVIYTRVGGANRTFDTEHPHAPLHGGDIDWGFGEDKMYAMPTFKRTYDDGFDATYGYYVFGVPDEWADDFKALLDGRPSEVSDGYVNRVAKCFGVDASDIRDVLAGLDSSEGYLGSAPDWGAFFEALRIDLQEGDFVD